MSPYPLHDHRVVDQATKAGDPGTDVITGVSVPRSAWFDVFEKIRPYFLKNEIDNVYGTFRMVGRDDETFLAWARERLACAIFTVHAEPTSRGLARLAGACRGTIDKAANRGGRYHLSYHRYASRKQVERCYPQFWSFCNRRRNRIRTRCFQAIGIDMPKNSLPIGNGPTDLDVTL
ncbi:MAG TPA: hypothetical protein VGP19_04195 [Candidatus Acidoferrales bacterium]|nr:hypothetical protein [Candidatus Acidoferrales bacterium]